MTEGVGERKGPPPGDQSVALAGWGYSVGNGFRGLFVEGEGAGDGRFETRIQAGGCGRAVGTGLAYPHMLSDVVKVVWGRSLRQRHLTGPLTGKITDVPVHLSGRRMVGTAEGSRGTRALRIRGRLTDPANRHAMGRCKRIL